jgi:transposase
LPDLVEGRSKHAFKTWLADRDEAWRNQVEVVAMDGSTGFKTATAEELPDAVAVMDPFDVVGYGYHVGEHVGDRGGQQVSPGDRDNQETGRDTGRNRCGDAECPGTPPCRT